MINLTLTQKSKLEAAAKRGELLEVLSPLPGSSIYQVKSQHTETFYIVKFTKRQDGALMASCNCEAGIKGRDCCAHIGAAGPVYKQELIDRKEAERASSPFIQPGKLFSCFRCWTPFTLVTGREITCPSCRSAIEQEERELIGA